MLVRVEGFRGQSHFAVARSVDGEHDWRFDSTPALEGDVALHPEDAWGIEDPRVVYLPELGQYAVTFTSYSEHGPLVSLALTEDLVTFERLGPVCPPDDKDAGSSPDGSAATGLCSTARTAAGRQTSCFPDRAT